MGVRTPSAFTLDNAGTRPAVRPGARIKGHPRPGVNPCLASSTHVMSPDGRDMASVTIR